MHYNLWPEELRRGDPMGRSKVATCGCGKIKWVGVLELNFAGEIMNFTFVFRIILLNLFLYLLICIYLFILSLIYLSLDEFCRFY